jgi:chemotaxis-related protein WspB
MLALVFHIGNERLALDVRRIRAVVPRVPLQTLAGSPPWLAGTFVYRGQVVSVVDLHRLAGVGACPPHLSSRIILVPQLGRDDGGILGLLAADVTDLQEVVVEGRIPTRWQEEDKPDFGEVLAERVGVLRLVDLERLLPESIRGRLPAPTPRESP